METKKTVSVDIRQEVVTGAGDVIELLRYKAGIGDRSYNLCKVLAVEAVDRTTADNWVYMMLISDDKYPLVISKECAQSILDNPEKGYELAYSRWLDRYR
ncbi:MAG: hypothetical protein IJ272_01370 [Clostridia bacterium]|nr:hypothetical protein [Clostridia bacterium]